MLVTVSDWGDNKGQRATHTLIKWLTFTASIFSLVLLIPLNFSYDIVKLVFLILTKSRTDKTIQCSVTAELNMQFCNEQTRAQPLFSPPCASATYGSARMSRRKNGLYYNLTHPINLLRVVLDWNYTSWKEALRFSIILYLCLYIYYGNSPVCMPNKHCLNVETGLIP